MSQPSFSDLVHRYLNRYAMTQAVLGEVCGLPQSTVSKILNGRQRPSPEVVTAFVKAFKLTGDEKEALLAAATRALGYV